MQNTTHFSTIRLRVLASIARLAIRHGADPELTLSYVIWPENPSPAPAATHR